MSNKDCQPKSFLLNGISCETQEKIKEIQKHILSENPHRNKVSETEAIFKAIHEYHKNIKTK